MTHHEPESERDVVTVTMTRSAAIAAADALTRAHIRMLPDGFPHPPASERDRKDYTTAEWLRWLVSRIEVGCAAPVHREEGKG